MADENKSNLCTQNLHLQILILCKKCIGPHFYVHAEQLEVCWNAL